MRFRICICTTSVNYHFLYQTLTSNKLLLPAAPVVDFSSCQPSLCHNAPPFTMVDSWPIHVALKVPSTYWKTFDIILRQLDEDTVLGVRLGLKEHLVRVL